MRSVLVRYASGHYNELLWSALLYSWDVTMCFQLEWDETTNKNSFIHAVGYQYLGKSYALHTKTSPPSVYYMRITPKLIYEAEVVVPSWWCNAIQQPRFSRPNWACSSYMRPYIVMQMFKHHWTLHVPGESCLKSGGWFSCWRSYHRSTTSILTYMPLWFGSSLSLPAAHCPVHEVHNSATVLHQPRMRSLQG